MSQHGPIVVVSRAGHRPVVDALREAQISPVIDVDWHDVRNAVDRLSPAAILIDVPAQHENAAEDLANHVAKAEPYIPLLLLDPKAWVPVNAIPFSTDGGNPSRIGARLRAALRVRALHATMLRRLADARQSKILVPDTDPAQDATVLLIGRGATYPALSVALGERMGVVGALSIEAAARHLNARDIDGIVLGEGFSPRVVDAFLTVLSEDTRFRNLPIVVPPGSTRDYDLPNFEQVSGDAAFVAASALPLIRQHAFEQRIVRTLKSIDGGGLLDPRTGLLTPDAFGRDFAAAVDHALMQSGTLSAARFAFDETHPRAQFDAARLLGRLMRRSDFATLQADGSLIAVFMNSELPAANAIARRLASVMKHTMHSAKRGSRIDPNFVVETLLPADSAKSILARLHIDARRAAS